MVIESLGALRFIGLFADFPPPVDVELLGATFDATDTLQRWLFDGSNWLEAPDEIPLTTKGDLLTFDTADVRLPVGGDGQILSANSSQASGLEWITNTSFISPLTTDGDVMIYNATDVRLGVGLTNQVLTVIAGFPAWANAQGGTPLTTKGDVFGFDTNDARIPIGADGQVLTADSVEALGLKWADPVDQTPLTTKGDIFAFSTVDDRLPVGGENQVLSAVAGEAIGLKWVNLVNVKAQLLTFDGTNLTQLGVGTDGQILSSDSVEIPGLKWIDNTGGGGTPIITAPNTNQGELQMTNDGRMTIVPV